MFYSGIKVNCSVHKSLNVQRSRKDQINWGHLYCIGPDLQNRVIKSFEKDPRLPFQKHLSIPVYRETNICVALIEVLQNSILRNYT